MAGARPKKTAIKKREYVHLDRVDKLDETKRKQWVLKTIEWMKEGYSPREVREKLQNEKDGSRSETAITAVISDANNEIVNGQFRKASELALQHRQKYDTIIRHCLATEDGDDKIDRGEKVDSDTYWKLREKKINAYSACLLALYQKEDLLQFHNDNFQIDINEEETIQVKEVKPKIDLSKLTLKEQVEIYYLMKKGRKDDNELLGITLNTVQAEQKVEDVEAVEVIENNVEKIKQEQLPAPPYKSPVSAADPTVKLRETLQKLAAARFKEVGKLTDDEEKLIK